MAKETKKNYKKEENIKKWNLKFWKSVPGHCTYGPQEYSQTVCIRLAVSEKRLKRLPLLFRLQSEMWASEWNVGFRVKYGLQSEIRASEWNIGFTMKMASQWNMGFRVKYRLRSEIWLHSEIWASQWNMGFTVKYGFTEKYGFTVKYGLSCIVTVCIADCRQHTCLSWLYIYLGCLQPCGSRTSFGFSLHTFCIYSVQIRG